MVFESAIYCPMKFESYPLDKHECHFMLGSYSFDDRFMDFKLDSSDIFQIENQVSNLDYAPSVRSLPKSKQFKSYGSLNYSITGCEIRLERNIKQYIVNYYIPSGLLVMVSWVNTKYTVFPIILAEHSSEIRGSCLRK